MRTKILITAAALLLSPFALAAESVKIPVGQQLLEHDTLERPKRGMNSDQVLEQFGTPQASSNTVGEPPITVWRYPGFAVYFEYNQVIHSVLSK